MLIYSGTITMVNETGPLVVDADFGNDSLISSQYPAITFGCDEWKPTLHPLFQVSAHC